MAIPADVTDPASVAELLDEVRRRLGPVDVLINNAGVIEVGPAVTMSVADYEEAMATNFWGMLYPTLALLPEMRARRSGRIVNITSIGGKLGIPHLLPYSASKFAAVGFSQGLRAEVAADGIKVVTVCPGLMRTGSPRNAIFRGRHRAEYAWFSISDALPGLSISAEAAARRIAAACRRGNAEVLFPIPARVAAVVNAVAPGLTASILSAVDRLLPGPDGASGGQGAKSVRSPFMAQPSRRSGGEKIQPNRIGMASMASTYNGSSSERWENLRRHKDGKDANVGKTERLVSGLAGVALVALEPPQTPASPHPVSGGHRFDRPRPHRTRSSQARAGGTDPPGESR